MQPSTSASELNMFRVGCVCVCVREGREVMEAETCQCDLIISAVNIAVTLRDERIRAKAESTSHSFIHFIIGPLNILDCAFQTQRRVRYTSRLLLIRDVQSNIDLI